ncbi:acyltransferas-like protein [Dothidotthia symphoricarpi CBS 119687]|uniref:Acyltransferas-like protein n=1 Tax=Dothidotthia symphoricarpi CBS 119687 TaxID=1392245 RepID=A0A6A5ZYP1_9PLEO|nr:acyltransferas-like protein [Dothidotthia symphoricarpi CBS 119687]KAF2124135.1 acyltransferas-like protein [Dothidotthia symphoricarpi CBS 119687]
MMPAMYNGLLDHDREKNTIPGPATWKPVRSARWSLDIVRPEFFKLRRGSSSITKKPLRSTAWLDGLRGFAAFLVYLHHNQLWAHGDKGDLIYENSFGFEGQRYFAALPFVRLFFSGGHFAVAIFFVISGYVLSIKSLGLIQKGQILNAADSVGSALFRRWIRLYLPIIAITLIWITYLYYSGIWVDGLKNQGSTYPEILRSWYYEFKNYSFVFTGNFYTFCNNYNPLLWSIPMEFKGSIIVYTVLSALSRCTRNARLWCEAGLVIYFIYIVDGWYGALFMSGMLLCDLDLLALDDKQPAFLSKFEGFKELIFFHLFILALYLGGVPLARSKDHAQGLNNSPGWKWLSYLKPQAVYDGEWFYLFWGAFLLVASVPRLPWLKRCFETRLCQYLARISFALYLVHGYLIRTLGDRLCATVGFLRDEHKDKIPQWVNTFPISTAGPMGLELAYCAQQLVMIPITLYAAELVTKLIDEPSVKVSNWFFQKTLAQSEQPRRQTLR